MDKMELDGTKKLELIRLISLLFTNALESNIFLKLVLQWSQHSLTNQMCDWVAPVGCCQQDALL